MTSMLTRTPTRPAEQRRENPVDGGQAVAGSNGADANRRARVFDERARKLAARRSDLRREARGQAVLVVALDGSRYGIELKHVRQVVRIAKCTPVPGGHDALLGIAELGGEVCSVVDLGRVLGLAEGGSAGALLLVLAQMGNACVGLRVDDVCETRQLAADETGGEASRSAAMRFVKEVSPEGVAVLDMENLLTHDVFCGS